jgi:hypothetical protein
VSPTTSVSVVGVNVTERTGTSVTVTCNAGDERPSMSAVIVVVPTPTPVINPLAETLATVGLFVNQLAVLPGIGWFWLSSACALTCTDVPTRSSCGLDGVSRTDDTCGDTLATASLDFTPSTVTLMRAVPAPVPVTTPVLLTVATIELLDSHTTCRFASDDTTFPAESMTVSVSWRVSPVPSAKLSGSMVTVLAGTSDTLTVSDAVRSSISAVIVAEPTARAVTTPLLAHRSDRGVVGEPGDAAAGKHTACRVARRRRDLQLTADAHDLRDGGIQCHPRRPLHAPPSPPPRPTFPSTDAVIVDVPSVTAVTSPVVLTEAMLGLDAE